MVQRKTMSSPEKTDNPRRVQYELFFPIPDFSEISLRDNQETMQRPFFSLSKSKRLKPIDYISPDKLWTVHVTGNPEYGIATIWDADIMIYLASHLNQMRAEGHNDLSQSIRIHPGNLLKRICWGTSGRAYERLVFALDRLQTTTIKTNIRSGSKSRETTFSWIDSYTHLVCEKTQRSLGMEITLSKWFFDGVLDNSNILSISPEYFEISSGLAKWLYRVSRKHAGGNGPNGFTFNLDTLYAKSGIESPFPTFKKRLLALVKENALPEVNLELVSNQSGKDQLKVTMRKYMTVPPTSDVAVAAGFETRSRTRANAATAAADIQNKLQKSARPKSAPPRTSSGNLSLNLEDVVPVPEDQVSASDMRALIEQVTSNMTGGIGSSRAALADEHHPVYQSIAQTMPTHPMGHAKQILDADIYQMIVDECPGWDLDVMMREFDAFLNINPTELPRNYSKRFLGYMRVRHERDQNKISV